MPKCAIAQVLCEIEVGLLALYTPPVDIQLDCSAARPPSCADSRTPNISVFLSHGSDHLWHDREEPLSVQHGLAIEDHDQEGRVITAEFPHFYLTNVYTPNSGAHARSPCPGRITC